MRAPLTVAYFTMEIGLESSMPTYAGGLGMLAADLMRSCAGLRIPAACVTLRWQHGYFHQAIHPDGSQSYRQMEWKPEDFLKRLPKKVTVRLEGRNVTVGVWVYELTNGDFTVPVYFLDTNLPENDPADRSITDQLYGGNGAMRLKQETVLGIGGVRMLRALGYEDIGTFHMNEGHAAFLTLELLRERGWDDSAVRRSCAFTTHTPVEAGHDKFAYDLAQSIMGDNLPWHIRDIAGRDVLSMTLLALTMSRYACGVSQVHGEVSRRMFPGYAIDAITNGVHHLAWSCPELQELFDKYCAGWRNDPGILGDQSRNIPDSGLWSAHQSAKSRLIREVNKHVFVPFDTDTLTIASARRVVPYKRPELLYENLERLKEVCAGKVQIIHAGNAHQNDIESQEVIHRMIQRAHSLKDSVRICYLENYNPALARLMTCGADIWLNTPTRLHEASGTSGMKACLNGVLNLSTLDGWWIEGYGRDPESGWRIGPLASSLEPEDTRDVDAEDIYTELEFQIIPEYHYPRRSRWIRRMKRAIGLLGYFNSDRCVREYAARAWRAD